MAGKSRVHLARDKGRSGNERMFCIGTQPKAAQPIQAARSQKHPTPQTLVFKIKTLSAPLRQVTREGGAGRAATPYIAVMNMLRTLIAPLAFLALSAAPALADKIALKELSAYLNALTTVQTDFTQINADGSVSLGKLYIKRPGRARFEYAPPDKSLVLASSGSVAIFDAKSNQPPEEYPLKRTPLNLILAEKIDLGRAKMVVGHKEVDNATRVVAQDPKNPEYGTIELVFTANPTTLRQWVITDDLGQQTTVILGEFSEGGEIRSSLFNIVEEVSRRKNQGG